MKSFSRTIAVDIKTAARAFVDQINKGVLAWAEAGEILVRMVDADPGAFIRIREVAPNISMDVLVAFEKIGRKKIYPYLLLDNSPGMKRLAQLPYDDQERHYNQRVKVVIGVLRGIPTVVEKSIGELTSQQAELVIAGDRIRTVEEQKKLFDAKFNGNRGHSTKSKRIHTEVSKFTSIGCFRLGISKMDGKPCLLKSHSVNDAAIIEIKSNSESGTGSDVFEIRVDTNLVVEKEEEIQEPEHALNSAVQNQIEELLFRRTELTALLRSKPEKKSDTEKAIKEINRKIASLESIA